MGENTKIEWADHTFNPWIGCTRVSPACDNCYAAAMMDNRYGKVRWGAGEDRVRTSAGNWQKPLQWERKAKADGSRPFVFCASLADIGDKEVGAAWRADTLNLWAATPTLIWLPLTKRIGNIVRLTEEAGVAWPKNAAIGATFANQQEWERDKAKLEDAKQKLGALFSFASFEPLLSPVIMGDLIPDWVIVGGESGPNARPMNLDWARALRDETVAAGKVFNFKQVGGRKADKGGHELDGVEYFARPKIAA